MNQKTFSFRFDIDSLADIEVGVPKLIDLAKELDIRFTFFVNMGRSFRWSVAGGQWSAKSKPGTRNLKSEASNVSRLTSHVARLGLLRTIRTVIFNPNIGLSHKKILFKLLDDGHELGLHGGMDHPLWQWRLDTLSKDDINDSLRPAYRHFAGLFGRPKGFASPGFRYNRYVLELIDEYGFEYASDMEGEKPFRPERFRHVQVPVNITGSMNIPLMEGLWSSGIQGSELLNGCKNEIAKKGMAIMYGHPAFEGGFPILKELLTWIKLEEYKVMTMERLLEYLKL